MSTGDPLPEGWAEIYDESYKTYYYFAASSQTSTWDRPTQPAPGIGGTSQNHSIKSESHTSFEATSPPIPGEYNRRAPADARAYPRDEPRGRIDSRGRNPAPRQEEYNRRAPADARAYPRDEPRGRIDSRGRNPAPRRDYPPQRGDPRGIDPRGNDPRGGDPRRGDPRDHRGGHGNYPPPHYQQQQQQQQQQQLPRYGDNYGRPGPDQQRGGGHPGGGHPGGGHPGGPLGPDGKRNHDTYAKIFVGGLSFETSEQAIGDCFSQMGRVREVIVVVDKNTRRPKGYAFVTFEHEDSAIRAMREMQGFELQGRGLRVELSGTKLPGGPGGNSNGPPSMNMNGGNMNGGMHGGSMNGDMNRAAGVDMRNEPIRGSRGRIRDDLQDVTNHKEKSCQVYVGSLNYEMRDPELRATFEKCGQIKEATVLMDRANPNRSRGYGFITFTTPQSAQNAIDQFNDAMIKGRRITVRTNTARRLERKPGSTPHQPTPKQHQTQQPQQSASAIAAEVAASRAAEAKGAAGKDGAVATGRSRSRSRDR